MSVPGGLMGPSSEMGETTIVVAAMSVGEIRLRQHLSISCDA